MRQHHHTRAGAGRVDLQRHGVTALEPGQADEARIALIAARYNQPVVDRLVDGALGALLGAGVARERILLLRVAGAWELPAMAAAVLAAGAADAVVALGCVIRGETSHYDVIVNESARGLMDLSVRHAAPVANGVLACETEEQALARAGGAHGNKGAEAALAALELVRLEAGVRAAAAP
jgi:6,7-dimethyl-8-ribityllumazine synthase